MHFTNVFLKAILAHEQEAFMLKALKSQLSLLAVEEGDRFAREIRERYGRSNIQWAVSKSVNLILIMPDLIARIRQASAEPGLSVQMRRLNQYVLIYLYHPYDFVAEDRPGLLGYLDDAYLVGTVYSRLKARTSAGNAAEDLARDLEASLEVVRAVLPKETRKIDRLVEELSRGQSDVFEKLMRREKPLRRS
jgi:uncharacterized membrane protein YkvA (DUF1232 family)